MIGWRFAIITNDGWLDWATRLPGPADKVYHEPNRAIGYIPHSAVGYFGGWAARLFSTDRRSDGRYTGYAAASVHGWIAYDGRVTQHYPLTASCWASGSAYPNTSFIAFESEGGLDPVDEPLTAAQLAANVRLIRELRDWRGWSVLRRPVDAEDKTANLYEHRECVRWGSPPTACPSARVPWELILGELNAAPGPGSIGGSYYVVKPGDTLSRIARRFGVDWQTLYAANREQISDPNLLRVGWRLAVPASSREREEPEVYVVQSGDTLFALSRRWGCSVEDLVAANEIANRSLIQVGQTLRRP